MLILTTFAVIAVSAICSLIYTYISQNKNKQYYLVRVSFQCAIAIAVSFGFGVLLFGLRFFLNMNSIMFLTITGIAFAYSAISNIICIARNKKSKQKLFCVIIASFLFCIGMETFVFNFNFFQTHNYVPISMNNYIRFNKNIDNTYKVDSNNKKIEITGIDCVLRNVYIDLYESNGENAQTIDVFIEYTDKANSVLTYTPQKTICNSVKKSQYITLQTSGKSNKLVVNFCANSDQTLNLNGVYLNANRPFDFSFYRMLLLFAFIIFIYFLRPGSSIYKKKYLNVKGPSKAVYIALYIQIVILIIINFSNPIFMGVKTSSKTPGTIFQKVEFFDINFGSHSQYSRLAESFLNGNLHLEEKVPQSLIDLDNPYDPSLRTIASKESGDSYAWDIAYYNGHYYVYFGVVPVLLLYLPFYALTSLPFPSAIGVLIFAILFSIGVFGLLSQIIKRWFKNTPLAVYILLSIGFINCSGILFLVKRPDFYSVPIMCGVAFSILGLYNWLAALNAQKGARLHYLLGSLCMALVAGCRPQLVMLSFVAIPLFYKKFFTEKYILTKDGIKDITYLLAPYIFVAVGLMWYNYSRFGSPFDFGANYNITTNDMTSRGFRVGRIGLSLFTYFFQPPAIIATFPFLKNAEVTTNYMGTTIRENCFGGIITSTPLLWIVLLFTRFKTQLKKKGLFIITLMCIVISFLIGILDAQFAGLLQRYFSDFGFILFLAASILILIVCEKSKSTTDSRNFQTYLLVGLIIGVIYNTLLIFSNSDFTINSTNPDLFYEISHSVQFWL